MINYVTIPICYSEQSSCFPVYKPEVACVHNVDIKGTIGMCIQISE